jgi:hypothetical protein
MRAFLYSDIAHKELAGLIRDTRIGTWFEREEKEAEMAGAALIEDTEEVDSEDEEDDEDDGDVERREWALEEAMAWLVGEFEEALR